MIAQTIESIEQNCRNQKDIVSLYEQVCNVYYNDLQANALRWLGTVAKQRYRHKHTLWLNNGLSDSWDQLLKCENDFKSYRCARQILRRLHEQLKIAQRKFDKVYHKTKRIFHDLLASNTSDPKYFWDKVNGLGPIFKKNDIPLETVLEDGQVIRDIEEVLEKWKCDYELLFSNVVRETFDEEYF